MATRCLYLETCLCFILKVKSSFSFFLISVINPFTTVATEAGQNSSECFLQKFRVLRFHFSRSPHSVCLLRRLKTTSVLGITLPRAPLALSSQNSHWRKLEAQSGTTRHVVLILFCLVLFVCLFLLQDLCIDAISILWDSSFPDCSPRSVTFGDFFKHGPFFCTSNQNFL